MIGAAVMVVTTLILALATKFSIFASFGVALVVGLIVTFIASRLYHPKSPHEDEIFSANELLSLGERRMRTGDFSRAALTFERALNVLGSGVELKLEGALLGRLGAIEMERGDFSAAVDHWKRALAIAEALNDVSGQVNRLNNLASVLGGRLNQTEEAIALMERAVELASRLGEPSRFAKSLANLSKHEGDAGRIDAAGRHAEEAVRTAEAGPLYAELDALAEALYARALFAALEKRDTDATADLDRALKLLAGRGFIALERNIAEARRTLERARGSGSPVTVGARANTEDSVISDEELSALSLATRRAVEAASALAKSKQHMMAAKAAEELLENTEIRSRPRIHAWLAMNTSDLLRSIGRASDGRRLAREGAELAARAGEHGLEAGCRLNLSICARLLGEMAEAAGELELALVAAARAKDFVVQAKILTIQGNNLRDSWDFAGALEKYTQARAMAKQTADIPLLGSIALSVGNLHMRRAEYDLARPELCEALRIGEDIKDDKLIGAAVHMLANAEKRRARTESDPDRRRELLEAARDGLKRSLSLEKNDDLGRALRLQSLGEIELNLGRVAECRAAFDEALQLHHRRGTQTTEVADLYTRLGALQVHCKEAKEGAKNLLRAHALDVSLLANVFSIAGEESRLRFVQSTKQRFDTLLSLICEDGALRGDAPTGEAIADAIIQRKAVTIDALIFARRSGARAAFDTSMPEAKELEACRRERARLIHSGQSMVGGEPTRTWIELETRVAELDRVVAKKFPSAAFAEMLKDVSYAKVAAELAPGSAVLDIVQLRTFGFPPPDQYAQWLGRSYLALLIRPDRPPQLIDLGDSEEIDRRASALLAIVARGESGWRSSSIALRQKILDPLEDALSGCSRLFIAPDGLLSVLPFEILAGNDGTLLADRFELSYLGAARDILSGGTSNVAGSQSVVIADPDFDLAASNDNGPTPIAEGAPFAGKRWARLPGTACEGRLVESKLAAKHWTGPDALEQAVLDVDSPRAIHFATHGFALDEIAPETSWNLSEAKEVRASSLVLSGLVLAGANTFVAGKALPPFAGKGLLTGEDVATMDLLGTRLVVLSACRTGLGAIHGGEGTFGLRRAFRAAGARALVVALWPVPDEATSQLMSAFYDALSTERDGPAALRIAQRSLRSRNATAHPIDWAGFIYIGDPEAPRGLIAGDLRISRETRATTEG